MKEVLGSILACLVGIGLLFLVVWADVKREVREYQRRKQEREKRGS